MSHVLPHDIAAYIARHLYTGHELPEPREYMICTRHKLISATLAAAMTTVSQQAQTLRNCELHTTYALDENGACCRCADDKRATAQKIDEFVAELEAMHVDGLIFHDDELLADLSPDRIFTYIVPPEAGRPELYDYLCNRYAALIERARAHRLVSRLPNIRNFAAPLAALADQLNGIRARPLPTERLELMAACLTPRVLDRGL
jgi:hypothetical protein